MPTFSPIATVSKREQVVEAVRGAIISGQLVSGDTIVEGRLAKMLNVSQPLIREALIELEHRGFVQRFPNRGTRVTKLTRLEIEQMARLRIELESVAVQWAKPNFQFSNFGELRDAAGQMTQAAERTDLVSVYEHALRFHERIWEIAGNEFLRQALDRIVIPLFSFYTLKAPHDRGKFLDGARVHRDLVDNMEKLNGTELRDYYRVSFTELQSDWINFLPIENGTPER